MMTPRYCCLSIVLLLLPFLAGNSFAADWPHWRGADRTDVVGESSRFENGAWPLGQPDWKTNVGMGCSSPVIVDGKLYITGWENNRDTVFCLDAASGKQLWSQSYACPAYGRHATGDQKIYSGFTSTPSFDRDTNLLYTLSTDGDLICWDTAQQGKRVWQLNLYNNYGVGQRPEVAVRKRTLRDYGYTSSALVQDKWIIVEVGDDEGNLMAFDKRTGKRLWVSECKDHAGHTGSPVPMTVAGIPCVAVLTVRNLVVTRLDAGHVGETLAQYKWTTDFANNIPTPAVQGNSVIITSAYNHYAMCRVDISPGGAKKVWESQVCSGVCSPIIHDGKIYWAWRGVHCVDFNTGKELWSGGRVGTAGSCVMTADDRLIVLANNGELSLVESAERSPKAYKVLAEQSRMFSTDAWPHVVLINSRLYCKDRRGNLVCFNLTRKNSQPPKTVAVTPGTPSETPAKITLPPQQEKFLPVKSWPGEAGLVFAWEASFPLNKILGSAATSSAKLTTRDRAKRLPNGWLDLSGGAILVQGADAALLQACKSTNQLALEAVIQTDKSRQTGPARILSFSSDGYHRNFTLAQENNRLVLRLRTPRTGENGKNPEVSLCDLPVGKPVHVIVSYADGQLLCFLNGQPVHRSTRVQGDFSNWDAQHLLFGHEWSGGNRDWSGHLQRVAIFNRAVGPAEAKQRFDLVKGSLNE